MKTAHDPRHKIRRNAVKSLFAQSFTDQPKLTNLAQEVVTNSEELDQKIEKAAPAWPVQNLNKIDLAILRLSVYELLNKNTPPKVIIDEAVELAKEFGSENSPAFVNGVLGTIYQDNTNGEENVEQEIKENEN